MDAVNSLVITQKGESQNGCYKKTKHAKFSEKQTFLAPWYSHVRQKWSFFGKFGVLWFFETPAFKIRHFALLAAILAGCSQVCPGMPKAKICCLAGIPEFQSCLACFYYFKVCYGCWCCKIYLIDPHATPSSYSLHVVIYITRQIIYFFFHG